MRPRALCLSLSLWSSPRCSPRLPPHRRPPRSRAPSTIPTAACCQGSRSRSGTSPPRCRARSPRTRQGRYVIAGLPPGAYELRAELTSFKPHVRRDLQLTIAQALVVNITLEVGGLSEEVTVAGDTSLVNTSSAELSFLVGSEAIDQLPLNGRNYTDLALMQPGVLAYPHRDGGSVVAHGLGMSVNGQDPRSNVYLLDGTLQNDFTNGPAGSAAGTALGTETVREFRVESNAYSAEFGRNSGGQINVLTKSGANNVDGSRVRVPSQRGARRPQLFRRRRAARLPSQPVRRHDRRTDRARSRVLLPRLRGAGRAARQDDQHGRARRQRAHRPAAERAGDRQPGRSRPTSRNIPRANGPSLGQGLASYTFPFNQRLDEHFAQGRVDYSFGGGTPALRPLHDRRYRPVPAHGLSAVSAQLHLAQPVLHQRVPRTSCRRTRSASAASASAGRASARTSRPTPRSRCRRSWPTRDSMGDIDIGGLRRFGPQSSGNLRLVQNVFSAQSDLVQTRGRHVLKAGGAGRALPGQHGQPDVQPRHLHVRRPERVPGAARRRRSSA